MSKYPFITESEFPFITEVEVIERLGEPEITNGFVKGMDIDVIGHFNNMVTLDMPLVFNVGTGVNPFATTNFTRDCGLVIRCMFDLLDIFEEDGQRLSAIKNVPCRVVCNNHAFAGIGNFMKNKFLLKDDLIAFLKEKGEKK